jgi:hypothetical protein
MRCPSCDHDNRADHGETERGQNHDRLGQHRESSGGSGKMDLMWTLVTENARETQCEEGDLSAPFVAESRSNSTAQLA